MNIMRNLIYLFVLITLFSTSCGKDDGPGLPPDPPPENDTLGTGWQKIPLPDSLHFNDVFFVNDMTGYLIADKYLAKSVNGGITWSKFNLPDSLKAGFTNLFFIDALHGWVVSGQFILITVNGGNSWQKAYAPGGGGYDIQFISPTQGFLTTYSAIYKSVNGGNSWTKISDITGEVSALYFLNNNLGWIAAAWQIRKTVDGGNTFAPGVSVANTSGIYVIQFTDNNHGWISSFNGNISRTINGGGSWEHVVTNGTYSDIQFFDNNNGFLFSGSVIYRTNDGGTTLIKEAVVRKSNLIEIHFTDPNHGWAVGDNGGLYRFAK